MWSEKNRERRSRTTLGEIRCDVRGSENFRAVCLSCEAAPVCETLMRKMLKGFCIGGQRGWGGGGDFIYAKALDEASRRGMCVTLQAPVSKKTASKES